MPTCPCLCYETRQRVFQINTGCHRNVHFPPEGWGPDWICTHTIFIMPTTHKVITLEPDDWDESAARESFSKQNVRLNGSLSPSSSLLSLSNTQFHCQCCFFYRNTHFLSGSLSPLTKCSYDVGGRWHVEGQIMQFKVKNGPVDTLITWALVNL